VKLSTWWQLLDFYEVLFVWPLVLVTLYLTITARTRRGRLVGVSFLVLWLAPFIHRAIGDVYFDYLCKHEAGEFIYRTVDNVEGILQMRPRDGSQDYFDRMANGDIPEDPWGHTNVEAQEPWAMIGRYRYIEIFNLDATQRIARSNLYDSSMKSEPTPGDKVARFFGYNGRELRSMRKEFGKSPISRFGFTWQERRTIIDRLFNVFPGEVQVKELNTQHTLAIMRGFFRVRPMRLCPRGKDDFFVTRFVEKVLTPANAKVEGAIQ